MTVYIYLLITIPILSLGAVVSFFSTYNFKKKEYESLLKKDINLKNISNEIKQILKDKNYNNLSKRERIKIITFLCNEYNMKKIDILKIIKKDFI